MQFLPRPQMGWRIDYQLSRPNTLWCTGMLGMSQSGTVGARCVCFSRLGSIHWQMLKYFTCDAGAQLIEQFDFIDKEQSLNTNIDLHWFPSYF